MFEDNSLRPIFEKIIAKFPTDKILKHLKEVNFDFADAYRIDQKVSNPNVEIFENGDGPFRDDLNRTKPKLVLKK